MKLAPVSEIYHPPFPNIVQDEPVTEHYQNWGYTIGYELGPDGKPAQEIGNTAIFRIAPQGMTEPVYVTKPEPWALFTITVLKGEGELLRGDYRGDVERKLLYEGAKAYIFPGDAYSYKNTSDTDDLVLHDVAVPAFRAGDDVELNVSRVADRSEIAFNIGSLACLPPSLASDMPPIYLQQGFYELIGEAAAAS